MQRNLLCVWARAIVLATHVQLHFLQGILGVSHLFIILIHNVCKFMINRDKYYGCDIVVSR